MTMARADEILNLDVLGLAAKMRSRELSPVEVTDAYLDRIAATEKRLCAYITVTAELARAGALAAEREIAAGHWRGTFHGVPIALKDLCCTRGIPTTSGSKVLADHVPDYDATVWTRLAAAGAILLGKLNMHEFACGGTAKTAWGTTLNPYDPERIQFGLGRRDRCEERGGDARQRHRRLDSYPGRVLRMRRAEADLEPGQP